MSEKTKKQSSVKDTVTVYCYRYIWKDKSGKLCVKYVTDVIEGHARFQEVLRNDPNVVSALREYQNEVNFAYIGFTESVKEENKTEVEKNEKNEG